MKQTIPSIVTGGCVHGVLIIRGWGQRTTMNNKAKQSM